MRYLAPAKINLFLEVVNERPDGYHNICSIMQTITLYDRIIVSTCKEDIEFECDWSNIGSPESVPAEKNIAYSAALLLKKYLAENKGARIKITKFIPSGAGLGGGSSDAAEVIKRLLKLWKRNISADDLLKLALKLGADVPFFIHGGCALAEGVGEKLFQIKTAWAKQPLSVVIVKPEASTSTKEIYSNLKMKDIKKPLNCNLITQIKQLKTINIDDIVFVNDLEENVFDKYSQVREIKNKLHYHGAVRSLMSGSGSSVFGIFNDINKARKTLENMKNNGEKAWLVNTLQE